MDIGWKARSRTYAYAAIVAFVDGPAQQLVESHKLVPFMRGYLLSAHLLEAHDIGRKFHHHRVEDRHSPHELPLMRPQPIKVFDVERRDTN